MDTGGIDGAQLHSVVERIEHLEEEIYDRNQDKKAVYGEAKSNGFDIKILKLLIARRRKDPDQREEQDTLLDLYERALEAKPSRARAREAESMGDAVASALAAYGT